jgi:hypothetical protein
MRPNLAYRIPRPVVDDHAVVEDTIVIAELTRRPARTAPKGESPC